MRMSVAFWRVRPAVKAFGSIAAPEDDILGARRCDSAISRRSSRSWARREGASSGSSFEEDEVAAGIGSDLVNVWSGGREDWFCMLVQ